MARKKKRRSISTRNFSKVNIKLNIPWSDKGQGNKSFFKIVDRNPELKEYLTKESFEKLYNTVSLQKVIGITKRKRKTITANHCNAQKYENQRHCTAKHRILTKTRRRK